MFFLSKFRQKRAKIGEKLDFFSKMFYFYYLYTAPFSFTFASSGRLFTFTFFFEKIPPRTLLQHYTPFPFRGMGSFGSRGLFGSSTYCKCPSSGGGTAPTSKRSAGNPAGWGIVRYRVLEKNRGFHKISYTPENDQCLKKVHVI